MKTFILTEGGGKIGFGHIARCFSLYQAFEERQIPAQMLIYGYSDVAAILPENGYQLVDWIHDSVVRRKLLAGSDLVIIDSMIVSQETVLNIAAQARAVACIDDARRITHKSDNTTIIDWTPFAEKEYAPIGGKNSDYLLGTKYISLRKPFWDVPEREIKEEVASILITMGGGDLRGLSPRLLKILQVEMPSGVRKQVVIGRGFDESIVTQLLKMGREDDVALIFYPGAVEMAAAFGNADIVVSGGGQTLYELARMGLPAIAIEVIDNQRLDIAGWHTVGSIDYAGKWNDEKTYDNVASLIRRLGSSCQCRREMGLKGSESADGQGARRIVDHLIRKRNEICI